MVPRIPIVVGVFVFVQFSLFSEGLCIGVCLMS
jgi:hypothetical protein